MLPNIHENGFHSWFSSFLSVYVIFLLMIKQFQRKALWVRQDSNPELLHNINEDKDKEALSNVAYNVTDNISSRAILRHNNYIVNRHLPALLYLPSTTPFMRGSTFDHSNHVAKELTQQRGC